MTHSSAMNPGDEARNTALTVERIAPLSFAQERLWFLEQLEPDEVLYNIPAGLRLKGLLNLEVFEKCIREVVKRHQVLRTHFREGDDGAEQVVNAGMHIPVIMHDLRDQPEDGRERLAGELVEEEAIRRFDLTAGPLMRVMLIRIGESEYICLLTMHHIVSDGWSMGVLVNEIAWMYGALIEERDPLLSPLTIQYADFAERQQNEMKEGILQDSLDYWQKKLVGVSTSPLLPGVTGESAGETHDADVVHRNLSKEISEAVLNVSSKLQASPYMTLLAAFSIVFNRYSDNDDLVLGSLIANRNRADLEALIGFFVNTLPLRLDLSGSPTVRELINRVRDVTLEAYGHQEIPFDKIVEISRPERKREAMPLVQVMVIMQNAPIGDLSLEGLTVSSYEVGTRSVRFDVEVYLWESEGSIKCDIVYKKALFDGAVIKRLWSHLEVVLKSITADVDCKVGNISLLTPAEKELLKRRGKGRDFPLPQKCIHELFSTQALETPQAIAAVEVDGISYTYEKLESHSNSIAHYLIRHGIQQGDRVGICMGRSVEMLAVLLGILKAGGIYVPMDPVWPSKRTAFVISDCGMRCVIVDSKREGDLQAALDESGGKVDLSVITSSDTLIKDEKNSDYSSVTGSYFAINGAYIIYTSGSTGEPKGVLVEHRSVVNYITWALRQYGDGKAVDFPLFSSLAFDLTVTSLFVPLISGGTVRIYDDVDATPVILRVVADDMVDVVKLTPAHLALVLAEGFSPKRIHSLILGGEDLKAELAGAAHEMSQGRVAMYNEYGPTEATVGCMIHKYDPHVELTGSVSIGGPIDNSSIYILDKHLNLTPAGVVGELCIGGAGVAREYFGREQMTAERFIESPKFPGSRIYRTGDRARWEKDGKITYLGRVDRQLKIRGYRVEPGEIESGLLEYPGIQNAAVICRQVSPKKTVVQYCNRCGIPSNFPALSFDSSGICNTCREFEEYQHNAMTYFRTVDDLREDMKAGSSTYDCLVLYSGGKDSTYMLCQLVEMGYRILIFTLDNGYLYDSAIQNIKAAVAHLGVDYEIYTPPSIDRILTESLEIYSNVCNGCFKSIYTAAIQTAVDKGIPYIVTGLSRGQLFETRLGELFGSGVFDHEKVDSAVIEARKAYHRMDDAVMQTMAGDLFSTDKVFEQIQFIDFYRYCDVTRTEIFEYLQKNMIWVSPTEIGCSTNCAVNDAGIHVHQHERGFHNYALPGSWEVRIGHRSREDFIEELDVSPDLELAEKILEKLNYISPTEETSGLLLAAFYSADEAVEEKGLREHLARKFPAYMIPDSFMKMDSLPLTVNGKVDYTQLEQLPMTLVEESVKPVLPQTPTEKILASIWRDVLNVECNNTNADFFEIGGHSLAATRVAVRIKRHFGIEIALKALFEKRSIGALAKEVDSLTVQGCEEGQVEEMLNEIEGLSESEILKLLA